MLKPYTLKLAKEARFCAARVARLTHHIYPWAATATTGEWPAHGEAGASPSHCGGAKTTGFDGRGIGVLIAMNDVARSVIGGKRDDHVRVEALLETA
jgi:hypothetical protein